MKAPVIGGRLQFENNQGLLNLQQGKSAVMFVCKLFHMTDCFLNLRNF